MLTEKEFQQLATAVHAMQCYNLNGYKYISAQNVLILLEQWTETRPEPTYTLEVGSKED